MATGLITYFAVYLLMNVIMFILADIEDKRICSDISQLTIVIPFEKDIKGALRTYKSVLSQREVEANIILAVNGDESEQIARQLRNKVEDNAKVISTIKKGKAHAINNALKYVGTEWFGVIDSDCELKDRDSLRILCDSITDKTIAVGGRLKVRRKWSPITWIQNMEYKRTFLHRRQVSRDLGCVTLISGAFGIFKKDIVLNAGGYCEEFVGEDMDIVLRIQRYCHRKHIKYRVGYEPRAVCFTNVPGGMVRLFRQRDRWQRGLIGSFIRNVALRFDKGITMQLIAIPYLLIFDVASPIVWMTSILQALKDIILDTTYDISYKNMWIIILLLYPAEELTLDLFAEIERTNLDRERLKIIDVLGIILLQVPKLIVYMFVIMPARFYGTITYAWRKNVW